MIDHFVCVVCEGEIKLIETYVQISSSPRDEVKRLDEFRLEYLSNLPIQVSISLR